VEGSAGGWSIRKVLFVEVVTLGMVFGAALLWTLRHLLLELLVSLVLAIVAEPAIKLLVRFKMRRSMSVVVVFTLLLGLVAVVIFVLSVPIYHGIANVIVRLPSLVKSIESRKGQLASVLVKLHIETYLQTSSVKVTQLITSAANPAFLAAKRVLSTIVNLIAIFILSVFISLEGPAIVRGVLTVVPTERAYLVRRVVDETSRGVTRYVLGNLLTSIIGGVVVSVSLSFLGVSYAPLLGLWVALVDLLPLVGGLLAGVPTVLIALIHSTTAGVVMLIVFIAYQQIENHVLNPLVFSRAVKLNPFWILFAVLVGDQLAHLEGALLAIPVASGLQVIGRVVWEEYSKRLPKSSTDNPLTKDKDQRESDIHS
jgi:predicted PurR-regulated permease PerM